MATQQTFAFLTPQATRPASPVSSPALKSRPVFPVCISESPVPDACDSLEQPKTSLPNNRESVLRHLRAQAGCISTAPADSDSSNTFSSGSPAIDDLLPRGGLKSDGITEWLSEADSCGAGAFSLIAAATHLGFHRGPLVIVDLGGTFYPPAAVAFGIPAHRMILVRPNKHADLVWSIDQALRCESIAAVWANVGSRLDDRDARRFQLAAETGRTPALLVRPAAVRGRPSFSDVRFHVRNEGGSGSGDPRTASLAHGASLEHGARVSRPRTLPDRRSLPQQPTFQPLRNTSFVVSVDRCRGGMIGNSVSVAIDDQANIQRISTSERHETAALHLASKLAHPTTAKPNPARRRHA